LKEGGESLQDFYAMKILLIVLNPQVEELLPCQGELSAQGGLRVQGKANHPDVYQPFYRSYLF